LASIFNEISVCFCLKSTGIDSEEDQSSLEWDNEGLAMEANLSSLHHADDEQEDGEDDDSGPLGPPVDSSCVIRSSSIMNRLGLQ